MRLLKLSALLVLVLFSGIGFLALFAVRSIPASGIGGAGGQVASQNGDVNCDGRLDITDPILVLEHLFRGGQEPCAFAQGGPGFPEVVEQLERPAQRPLSWARSTRFWPRSGSPGRRTS